MKNSNVSLPQAHETALTLRKAGATAENFWTPLAQSEELAKKVIKFIETTLRFAFTLTWEIVRDMTGWRKLNSDVVSAAKFIPRLQEILFATERFVTGSEVVSRAKMEGIYTKLQHAEAMLRDCNEIRAEWRSYDLLFPEEWVGPDGNIYLWSLVWHLECWSLMPRRRDGNFGPEYRLIGLGEMKSK